MSVMRSQGMHTSSVVSCTFARCQSMKVLSSFSSAQLFLRRPPSHLRPLCADHRAQRAY